MLESGSSLVSEFIDEIEELIERVTLSLTKIESGDDCQEHIHSLYREFHSLKGNAFLCNCPQIGQVAHLLESSLDPIRKGLVQVETAMIDVVYEVLDLFKNFRSELVKDGKEPDFSDRLCIIIPRIASITSGMFEGEYTISNDSKMLADGIDAEIQVISDINEKEVSRKPSVSDSELRKVEGEVVKKDDNSSDDFKENSDKKDSNQTETLRVPVDILDNLMNLVGELVLVRNQYLQNATLSHESHDSTLTQHLNVVTEELQDEVMKTRMQPIGSVLAKYQRVVRDLAKSLDKKINLVMEGNETELDKTLLEAVKDPIMHIVRNSVDHGIEMPRDRESAGKNPAGTIQISSYHEGGQVVVKISDNGKGLNRSLIIEKIIEKNLASHEALQTMTDRDVFMFIFAPGFSTAEKITNVSGRGVGMDVVRTNIEQIGGTIELNSNEGKGTVIKLKIPLTLAIIPALIVKSCGDRFAIPQVKLLGLVRLEKDENGNSQGVENLQGKLVYRLRGEILPLVRLNDVLEMSSENEMSDSENIVILNSEGATFGLVVDEIDDSTDIVVKPLMPFLKDQTIYSGATVLGDGKVALAVDVTALANRVGILGSQESDSVSKDSLESDENLIDNADYLLIDVGVDGYFSVPVCLVKRLEEFNEDTVEITGSQKVIRYRDGLLPILSVRDFLGFSDCLDDVENKIRNEKCSVIVVEKSGRLFGLEVSTIIDIVSANSLVDAELADRPGILGTMVIDDRVVALIDVYAIIEKFTQKRGIQTIKEAQVGTGREKHMVLVVEDNAFFRSQITKTLTEGGFRSMSAVNGENGLNLLQEKSKEISVVLSDIEMPIMTGLEMATAIKKIDRLQEVPLVALTTRFSKSDLEKGREAGFCRYLEKLDPQQLVLELDQVLGLQQ